MACSVQVGLQGAALSLSLLSLDTILILNDKKSGSAKQDKPKEDQPN